jgi:hypothetical protein
MSLSRTLVALLGSTALAVVLVLVVAFGGSTRTEARAEQYAKFTGPGLGFIRVPDDADLDLTGAITLEAWVIISDYEAYGGGNCASIAGKDYFSSYWLGICDGKLVFYSNGMPTEVSGTGTIPLDIWTHVAATYNPGNNTTKLYIDGELDVSTEPQFGFGAPNSNPFRIGADGIGGESPMGALDEVRLWNDALTQGDIQSLMNTTITTPETGLVGVWNMEGDGDDATGNGHDGMATGDIMFTADPTGSATAPATPSPSATPTPSPTPTSSPTNTPNVSETATPTPTPSPTPVDSGTTTVTASPVPGGFVKGDADCDGVLNVQDAMAYLEQAAGLGGFPMICFGSPAAVPRGGGQWFNAGTEVSGYIEIPYDAALNPADHLTIEMVIRPHSYVSQDGSTCPSLIGNGYDEGYGLFLCEGHLKFYWQGNGLNADSVATIPMRTFTHVAVTADATNVKFYINGVLDSEHPGAPLGQSTNPVRIASDFQIDYRPWAAIDEVRIWNVIRSEGDIFNNKDVETTAGMESAGLVAGYRMNGNLDDVTTHHNGVAVGDVELSNNVPPINWVDLNCDGFVDVLDALYLLRNDVILSNLPVSQPCESIGEVQT